MTDAQLDEVYTALAQAVARVGEAQAPLFLSMLSLQLLSRQPDAERALDFIRGAESGLKN
jgi:hypothetical protein